MVMWFILEFLLRIWSAGCRSRYQQMSGRAQFLRRPLAIVGMYERAQPNMAASDRPTTTLPNPKPRGCVVTETFA